MAKRTRALPTANAPVQGRLGEWTDGPTQTELTEWGRFIDELTGVVDPSKLARAMEMLRSERFRLFADVQAGHAIGVVRSQGSSTRVYSCRLAADGSYACCTQNLITCVVSRDSPCKHLLVLIVGLARAGELDRGTALAWLRGAHASSANKVDKDLMAATFLRYKGVQAGEVDWRPTETIPEDFYAM